MYFCKEYIQEKLTNMVLHVKHAMKTWRNGKSPICLLFALECTKITRTIKTQCKILFSPYTYNNTLDL